MAVLISEKLVKKMYDNAVNKVKRRKDEVTVDHQDVEAEYTIKLLKVVLGL